MCYDSELGALCCLFMLGLMVNALTAARENLKTQVRTKTSIRRAVM